MYPAHYPLYTDFTVGKQRRQQLDETKNLLRRAFKVISRSGERGWQMREMWGTVRYCEVIVKREVDIYYVAGVAALGK